MTFGENLKVLRCSNSLSQKELAEKLGFASQSISKWERGDSLPDIITLLEIAKFFGTTTDALLGHAPEKNFAELKIGCDEASILTQYPSEELKITNKIAIVIDGEGKIAAIISVSPWNRRQSYVRRGYDQYDDESSNVIYETEYTDRGKKKSECKKLKIPVGGFVLYMRSSDFATRKIMKFIIPEEYRAFLDPVRHPRYFDTSSGKSLFSAVLGRGELDYVSAELTEGGIIFKKPAETVDPMSVNIETLAKIVRQELSKEHDRQIEELKERIDALEDMIDDAQCTADGNNCRIDDFESKIEELESKIEELEGKIEELEG